jgi:predicted O-methyltransferase YrrM
MGVADTARSIRNAAVGVKEGLYSRPGHYLSPLPGDDDTRRGLAWAQSVDRVPGVDLDEAGQLRLFAQVGPFLADVPVDGRFSVGPENNMFSLADAAVYSALIREFSPARIVEVGSGYSSAVALDTADRWRLPIRFTFVEPFPDRLLGLLTTADRQRVDLRRESVQESPAHLFANLSAGDFLFVDSSHVVKTGSDVVRLLTRVLPLLKPGVVVHVHDIFWPFEYPESWLKERRGWNEVYFVHALLVHNSAYKVRLFNDWIWQRHPDLVECYLPAASGDRPGSLWLQKVH